MTLEINLIQSKCTKLITTVILALSFFSCTKKADDTLYTNCKLPRADGNTAVSISGFPRIQYRLASTGTVNATVIFVDFPDKPATKTPAQAYAMISGATATFTEQSYGRMTYTMTPNLQWFRMSQASTSSTYASSRMNLVREAVTLADSAVNFATTDSLIVITDPDITAFSNGPSFPGSPGGGVTADGKEMYNIAVSGNDLNTWGSIWLNHEVTHTLGLVDLYKYNTGYPDLLYASGKFSYMGFGSFTSNAPGLTAWERWVLGWLDDAQVLCSNPRVDGEINTLITPIGTNGGQKAVVIPISETKVVVVESRRASGIDSGIAKTGALVYTIDSSIATGAFPLQVYPKGGSSDPYSTTAPRAVGESVTVSGIKVEVTAASASGDTVRITTDGISIDH